MELHSHNEAETEAAGARLAAALAPGAVVAYEAAWAWAKPPLPVALPAGLGYKGRVTSPTFTIVNEYEGGRLPLFHFDMYRLNGADDLFDIGWEDYLARGGVCAVEWSEQVADALPEDTVWVTHRPAPGAGRLADHYHRRRWTAHEDFGTGDLGQGRLRRRDGERAGSSAAGYQDTGLTHSRTLMPIVEHHSEKHRPDAGGYGRRRRGGRPRLLYRHPHRRGRRQGAGFCRGQARASASPPWRPWPGTWPMWTALVVCAMDARRSQIYNALLRRRRAVSSPG